MSILNTLSAIKKEGFNPETDAVQGNTKLPAGNYPVRFKSVMANVSQSGRTQLSITLEVVSGKDKNRLETIFLSFDDGLPDFVKEKNGKILLKIASLSDVALKESDLADEYTTAAALEKGLGAQFEMRLTITENKKKPEHPYRNYDFVKLSDKPAQMPDFNDDDLPF